KSGIETPEDGEKVRGAEGKADTGDVLLNEFQGVEADDFAAGIQERATGVSGVDGSVCLDPGTRPGRGKLTDSANDAFGDAKEHGVARAANCEDGVSLANGGKIGEGKKGKDEVWRRRGDLDKSDVEVGVNVNDFGLQLYTAGEQCEERTATACDMSVRSYDAGFR